MFEDSIYCHNHCLFYGQILEKRDENVNATEILVSKERERIEALEKTLKQREAALSEKQHNLVRLNHIVEFCFYKSSAEKKLIVKVSFPNFYCDVKETTVNVSLSS
mgnify:FL=1